jgi:hypothetical protein
MKLRNPSTEKSIEGFDEAKERFYRTEARRI